MGKYKVNKDSIAKPVGFGETLTEIFEITGKNTDFSTFAKPQGKDRILRDKTGVVKETKEKINGRTIAE
jgi:hypothetical protein